MWEDQVTLMPVERQREDMEMDSTGCDSALDTTDLFLPFNSREIESPAYPRDFSKASGISTEVLCHLHPEILPLQFMTCSDGY